MFDGIDLYSDTMTKPNQAMKEAMMAAPLGDEQIGEDPTTKKLEEEMAKRLQKSAAMFFSSATLCNQIAVNLHTEPGDEVIGADSCHIFIYEAGGTAFHSRVQARAIPTKDGTFDGEHLRAYTRFGGFPHSPRSSLVLVENTTNSGGGVAWPMAKLASVIKTAQELKLKTHVDGARIFNAACAVGHEVHELARGFDSVTVCFSKGLSCAGGAILAFDHKLWDRVRKLKQVFGGAMRQSGILAAGCLYALEHNIEKLKLDHKNARLLAESLSKVSGVRVEDAQPSTNMVFFSIDEQHMSADAFADHCTAQRFRFSRLGFNRFRAVLHSGITEADVRLVIQKIAALLG